MRGGGRVGDGGRLTPPAQFHQHSFFSAGRTMLSKGYSLSQRAALWGRFAPECTHICERWQTTDNCVLPMQDMNHLATKW